MEIGTKPIPISVVSQFDWAVISVSKFRGMRPCLLVPHPNVPLAMECLYICGLVSPVLVGEFRRGSSIFVVSISWRGRFLTKCRNYIEIHQWEASRCMPKIIGKTQIKDSNGPAIWSEASRVSARAWRLSRWRIGSHWFEVKTDTSYCRHLGFW
jgi:hypothetical protein